MGSLEKEAESLPPRSRWKLRCSWESPWRRPETLGAALPRLGQLCCQSTLRRAVPLARDLRAPVSEQPGFHRGDASLCGAAAKAQRTIRAWTMSSMWRSSPLESARCPAGENLCVGRSEVGRTAPVQPTSSQPHLSGEASMWVVAIRPSLLSSRDLPCVTKHNVDVSLGFAGKACGLEK